MRAGSDKDLPLKQNCERLYIQSWTSKSMLF